MIDHLPIGFFRQSRLKTSSSGLQMGDGHTSFDRSDRSSKCGVCVTWNEGDSRPLLGQDSAEPSDYFRQLSILCSVSYAKIPDVAAIVQLLQEEF